MHGQHQTLPQAGDVLISKPTAIAEHDVSIVAVSASVLRARYDLAVTEGRKLAEQLKVDLWLTQDHRHFLQLAGHRGLHRQQ